MGHIHELIDFVVSIYIVYKNRVLLVHHKQLNRWLPVGGHIELHEDPDQAAIREVKEETGLRVKIRSPKLRLRTPGTKFLYTPRFANIHKIKGGHKHTTLIYFAEAKSGKIKHNREEHNQIRWFTKGELKGIKIKNSVYFYATEALKELGN
jgi:8-oxo-dGTP pyrophosphatase MutT (NUDIX family)